MSYVHKKIRVFKEAGDIEIHRKRSDGRMKTYSSATDARAWCDSTEDRRQHILDLIRQGDGKGLSLGKYIPIEAIIDILLANKNADIRRLQREIEELKRLLRENGIDYEEKMQTVVEEIYTTGGETTEYDSAPETAREDDIKDSGEEKKDMEKIPEEEITQQQEVITQRQEVITQPQEVKEPEAVKIETPSTPKDSDTAATVKKPEISKKAPKEAPRPVISQKTSKDAPAAKVSETVLKVEPAAGGAEASKEIPTTGISEKEKAAAEPSQKASKEFPPPGMLQKESVKEVVIKEEPKIPPKESKTGKEDTAAVKVQDDQGPSSEEDKSVAETEISKATPLELSSTSPIVSDSSDYESPEKSPRYLPVSKEDENAAKELLAGKSPEDQLLTLKTALADTEAYHKSQNQIALEAIQMLENIKVIVDEDGDVKKGSAAEKPARGVSFNQYDECNCENEISSLEREIESMKSSSSSESEIVQREIEVLKKYCAKLATIQKENADLKRERDLIKSNLVSTADDALKSKLAKLDEITQERDRLKARVEQLERELSSYGNLPDKVDSFKEKAQILDSLQKDEGNLRQRLDRLRGLEEEVRNLKKKCAASVQAAGDTTDKDKLLAKIAQLEKEANDCKSKMKELEICKVEKNCMKMRLEDLSKIQRDYEDLLKKTKGFECMKAECALYKTKYEELKNLEAECNELRAKAQRVDELENERAMLMKEIEDCECCMNNQESEIKKLACHIECLTQDLDKRQDDMKSKVLTMRADLEKKDCLIAKSEQQLADVQDQLKNSIESLSCESTCLRMRIEDLEADLDECLEINKNLEAANKELEAKKKSLEEELKTLEDAKQKFEEEKKALLDKLGNLENDNKSLKDSLESEKANSEKLDDALRKSIKSDEHLQNMLKQAKCAIKCISQKLEKHDIVEIGRFEAERENYLKKIKALEEELAEQPCGADQIIQLEDELIKVNVENKNLKDQLEQLKSIADENENLKSIAAEYEKLKNIAAENENLKNIAAENESLKSEIEALKQLTQQLQATIAENEVLKKSVQELQEAAKSQVMELKDTNEKISKQGCEVAEQCVHMMENLKEKDKTIEDLRAEIEKLKEKGRSRQSSLSTPEPDDTQIGKLKAQINILNAEIDRLNFDLEHRKQECEETIKRLNKKIQENSVITEQCECVEEERENLLIDIERYKKESELLKAELDRLRKGEKVDEPKPDIEIKEQKPDVEKPQEIKDNLENENKDLKDEINRLKQELAARENDNKKLKEDLEQKAGKTADVAPTGDQQLSAENQNLKDQLAKLQQELDSRPTGNKELEDKLKKLEQDAAAKDQLDSENKKLKDEINKLKQELALCQSSAPPDRGEDFSKERDELLAQIDAQKKEISDLLNKIKEPAKSEDVSTFKELENKTKENEKLRSTIEDLERQLKELSKQAKVDVPAPAAEIEQTVKDLQQSLEKEEARVRDLQSSNDSLKKENNDLAEKLKKCQEINEELKKKANELQEGARKSVDRPSTAGKKSVDKTAAVPADDRIKQLENELAKQKKECSDMLASLKQQYDRDIKNLQKQNEAAIERLQKTHLEEMNKLNTEHEKETSSLKEELKGSEKGSIKEEKVSVKGSDKASIKEEEKSQKSEKLSMKTFDNVCICGKLPMIVPIGGEVPSPPPIILPQVQTQKQMPPELTVCIPPVAPCDTAMIPTKEEKVCSIKKIVELENKLLIKQEHTKQKICALQNTVDSVRRELELERQKNKDLINRYTNQSKTVANMKVEMDIVRRENVHDKKKLEHLKGPENSSEVSSIENFENVNVLEAVALDLKEVADKCVQYTDESVVHKSCLEELQQKNDKLTKKVQQLEAAKKILSDGIKDREKYIAWQELQIAKLTNQIGVKTSNNQINEQIKQTKSFLQQKDSTCSCNTKQKQIEQLENEKRVLIKKIEDCENYITDQLNEMKKISFYIDCFAQKIQKPGSKTCEHLRSKIRKYKKKLANKNRKNQILKEEINKERCSKRALEDALERTMVIVEENQNSKNEEALNEINRLRYENEQMFRDIESYRSVIKNQEAKIQNLEFEFENMEKTKEQMDCALSHLQNQVDDYKDQIRNNEETSRNSHYENLCLNERVKELERQIDDYETNLTLKDENNKVLLDDLQRESAEKATLQLELAKVTENYQNLKQMLEDARQTIKCITLKLEKCDIARLETEKDNQIKIYELKSQLAAATASTTKLRDHLKKMKETMDKNFALKKLSTELNKQICELHATNQDLSIKSEKMTQMYDKLKQELYEKDKTFDDLKMEFCRLRQQLDREQQILATVKASSGCKLTQLKSLICSLNEEINELHVEIECMKRTPMGKLQEHVKTLENENVHLRKEVNKYVQYLNMILPGYMPPEKIEKLNNQLKELSEAVVRQKEEVEKEKNLRSEAMIQAQIKLEKQEEQCKKLKEVIRKNAEAKYKKKSTASNQSNVIILEKYVTDDGGVDYRYLHGFTGEKKLPPDIKREDYDGTKRKSAKEIVQMFEEKSKAEEANGEEKTKEGKQMVSNEMKKLEKQLAEANTTNEQLKRRIRLSISEIDDLEKRLTKTDVDRIKTITLENENKNLKIEISKLKDELEKRKSLIKNVSFADVQKLAKQASEALDSEKKKDEVEPLKSKLESERIKNVELAEKWENSEKEMEKLRSKIDYLEKENTQLKEQKAVSKRQSQDPEVVENWQDRIMAAVENMARSIETIKKMQTPDPKNMNEFLSQIEEFKKDVEGSMGSRGKIVNSVSDSKFRSKEDLEQQLKESEKRNETLKKKIEEISRMKGSVSFDRARDEKIRELEKKNASLKSEVEKLRLQKAPRGSVYSEQSVDKSSVEFGGKLKTNRSVRSIRSFKSEEDLFDDGNNDKKITVMEKKLIEWQTYYEDEISKLKRQLQEASENKDVIEGCAAHERILKELEAKLKNCRIQYEALEKKYSQLENENDRLSKMIRYKDGETESLDDNEQRIQDLVEHLRSLQNKNETLKTRMIQLELDNGRLKNDLERIMGKEHKTFEQELQKLRELEKQSAKMNDRYSHLKKRLMKLEIENKNLKQEYINTLIAKEKIKLQINEQAKVLREINKILRKTQEKKQSLTSRLVTVQMENEELNKQLGEKNETFGEENTALKQENAQLRRLLRKAGESDEDLRDEAEKFLDLTQDADALKTKIIKLEKENALLKKELDLIKSRDNIISFENLNQGVTQAQNEWKMKAIELEIQNEYLKTELETREHDNFEIATREKRISELEEELQKLTLTNQDLKRRTVEMELDNEYMKKEIERITKIQETLRTDMPADKDIEKQMHALKMKNDQTELENRNLKKQLENMGKEQMTLEQHTQMKIVKQIEKLLKEYQYVRDNFSKTDITEDMNADLLAKRLQEWKEDFESQLLELKQDFEKLTGRGKGSANEMVLKTCRENAEKLEHENKNLRMALEILLKEKRVMANVKLVKEVEEQLHKYNRRASRAGDSRIVNELKDQLQQCQEVNEMLRNEKIELERHVQEERIKDLESQIRQYRIEASRDLPNRPARERKSIMIDIQLMRVKELEQQVQEIQESKDELKTELDKLREDKDFNENELREQLQINEELKIAVERFKKINYLQQQRIQDLERQSALSGVGSKKKNVYFETGAEVENLRKEYLELREQYEKSLKRISELEDQLRKCQDMNRNLKKELARLTQNDEFMDDSKNEQEKNDKRKGSDDLKDGKYGSDAEEDGSEEVNRLRNENDSLKKDIKKTKDILWELEGKYRQMKTELEGIYDKVGDTKENNEILRKELMEKDNENKTLKEEINNLFQNFDSFELEIKNLKDDTNNLIQVKLQLEKENLQQKEEIAILKSNQKDEKLLKELEEENQTLRFVVADVQKENEDKNIKIKKILDENCKLKELIANTKEEIEIYKNHMEGDRSNLEQQKLKILEETVLRYRDNNEFLKARIKQLEMEASNAEMNDQIEEIQMKKSHSFRKGSQSVLMNVSGLIKFHYKTRVELVEKKVEKCQLDIEKLNLLVVHLESETKTLKHEVFTFKQIKLDNFQKTKLTAIKEINPSAPKPTNIVAKLTKQCEDNLSILRKKVQKKKPKPQMPKTLMLQPPMPNICTTMPMMWQPPMLTYSNYNSDEKSEDSQDGEELTELVDRIEETLKKSRNILKLRESEQIKEVKEVPEKKIEQPKVVIKDKNKNEGLNSIQKKDKQVGVKTAAVKCTNDRTGTSESVSSATSSSKNTQKTKRLFVNKSFEEKKCASPSKQ